MPNFPHSALVRMTRHELRAYAATSFAAGQRAALELQRRQQKRFEQYEQEIMQAEVLWQRIAALQKHLAKI